MNRQDPGLTDLEPRTWRLVASRSTRAFVSDGCLDLAAALTYYAMLSIFPATIALLSLIGLVGSGPKTVSTLLDILRQVGAGSAARTLEPTLTSLATAQQAAGFAFVLGLGAALWSASGYVGAFGRALNRIYGFEEGRPIWKLKPLQLLVTLGVLVLIAFVALALVVSGSLATSIGDAIGLGSTGLTIWRIVKWPLVLAAVVFVVGVLYYATPNVRHPKFRWISVGAVAGIAAWIVATALFGLYVGNFSSYNKVYGSLAGAVVFLLWLWITNLALLMGAEVDVELERGRELHAGLAAEESLQLQPRDTRGIDKARDQEREDIARARELRQRDDE